MKLDGTGLSKLGLEWFLSHPQAQTCKEFIFMVQFGTLDSRAAALRRAKALG